MSYGSLPPKQGLYDPANEHDACGVGFVAHIKGEKRHEIVRQGLTILDRLTHRGAVGADPRAGDGAGMLMQLPDAFFRAVVDFELPAEGEYAARRRGASGFGFTAIVGSGPRANAVVPTASSRRMNAGEMVMIGLAPKVGLRMMALADRRIYVARLK